jgi:hypothetical protein
MEVTIKNISSRILLERADNGVILYDISEDNSVSSKVLYEVYYKDGIIDFHNIGVLMVEIMESLKIPVAEEETNRRMLITITKIDPDKPMIDVDGLDDDDDDDDE